MNVRITSAAEIAIDELDDWWRENRPSSRLAIPLEIQRVVSLLQENPNVGSYYDAKEYPTVRRYRLKNTPYYLYYEINEEQNLLLVIALWSSMRDKGPPL